MKKLLIAALALVSLTSITPVSAGSLTLTYRNTSGSTIFAPSATISDTDANTFIAWCQSNYSGQTGSNTVAGCFNIFADAVFTQLKNNILTSAQSAAAQAIAPIAITPAQ